MSTPSDEEFARVRSDIRYRQGGVLRKAAYIETAGGLVRVRTKDGVQLVAPISDLTSVRGSWWRPGGFSAVAEGRRHKMAISIRGGPDREGSGWFTDIDVIDMVLIVIYIVVSPFIAIYLIRTRRRWVKILRGKLDPTPRADQAPPQAA